MHPIIANEICLMQIEKLSCKHRLNREIKQIEEEEEEEKFS